jgi:hypothetical protein
VTVPDEVEEPGWRVQVGVGLVAHAPLSDERRALIAREAEKERKAAEFEEEQRRPAALERRWELERQACSRTRFGMCSPGEFRDGPSGQD